MDPLLLLGAESLRNSFAGRNFRVFRVFRLFRESLFLKIYFIEKNAKVFPAFFRFFSSKNLFFNRKKQILRQLKLVEAY